DRPELKVISLMGRRREQNQISRVLFKCLGKLVVLCLSNLAAVSVGGEMMRFIENHEIPTGRFQEALYPRRALQGIDARNQAVVLREGVGLAVGNVALGSEDFEFEIENLVEFAMPVVYQSGGNDHQRAREFSTTGQLSEQQSGFDGFSKANFV